MAKKLTSENGKNLSNSNRNSISMNDENISKLRKEISNFSYEDSLSRLDLILEKLKNEKLLVDNLQNSFLEGMLYIEHCEKLLDKVEQEVLQINIDEYE